MDAKGFGDGTMSSDLVREPHPGLFVVRGEYRLVGKAPDARKEPRSGDAPSALGQPGTRPRLLLPVPLSYREQVPLTYELFTVPPESIALARIYEDRPGNFVADVVLQTLGPGRAVKVRWSSVVLCGPRSFEDVPDVAPMPESWPIEVEAWLRSTRCVQTSDPSIVEVAEGLRSGSDDALAVIEATLTRAEQVYAAQEGECEELGAVEALTKQGSCTSRANLVAALLRANRIPSRILAGYPTWCGPLQTHYIVEAFVPGYGWYPIESSAAQAPWPPHLQIEVAVVSPEYEDRSEPRFDAAGGVPYLSLTEFPDYDGTFSAEAFVKPDEHGDPEGGCDHLAEPWIEFNDAFGPGEWDRTLALARIAWERWVGNSPKADANSCLRTSLCPESLAGASSPADVADRLSK